jgi:hypothetical protein
MAPTPVSATPPPPPPIALSSPSVRRLIFAMRASRRSRSSRRIRSGSTRSSLAASRRRVPTSSQW